MNPCHDSFLAKLPEDQFSGRISNHLEIRLIIVYKSYQTKREAFT